MGRTKGSTKASKKKDKKEVDVEEKGMATPNISKPKAVEPSPPVETSTDFDKELAILLSNDDEHNRCSTECLIIKVIKMYAAKQTDKLVGEACIPLDKAYDHRDLSSSWPLCGKDKKEVGFVDLNLCFYNQKSQQVGKKISDKITGFILRDYVEISKAIVAQEKANLEEPLGINDLDQVLQDNLHGHTCPNNPRYILKIDSKTTTLEIPAKEEISLFLNRKEKEVLTRKSPKKEVLLGSLSSDIIEIYITNRGKEVRKIQDIPITHLLSDRNEEEVEMSYSNRTWTFELICSPCCTDQRETLFDKDKAQKLLLLLYYKELSNMTDVSTWNGKLSLKTSNILAILCPHFPLQQWKTMTAITLLRIQKIFMHLGPEHLYKSVELLSERNVLLSRTGKKSLNDDIIHDQQRKVLIEQYEKHCLEQIANFIPDKLNEVNYCNQLNWMIKCLNYLYQDKVDQLKNEMNEHIQRRVSNEFEEGEIFKNANCNNSTDEMSKAIKYIYEILPSYDRALCTIIKRFHGFGRNIWTPILVDSISKILLPRLETYVQHLVSGCNNGVIRECDYQLMFSIYILLRNILGHGGEGNALWNSFYHTFEPCLEYWPDVVTLKAKKQIEEILEEEKTKSLARTSARAAITMERSKEITIDAYKIPQSDIDYSILDELEGAISLKDIFHHCIKTWKELKWPENLPSLKFGTELFQRLHFLFLFYVDRLRTIIEQHSVIECEHLSYIIKSMLYSKQQHLVSLWNDLKEEVRKCEMNKIPLGNQLSAINTMHTKAKNSVDNLAKGIVPHFITSA